MVMEWRGQELRNNIIQTYLNGKGLLSLAVVPLPAAGMIGVTAPLPDVVVFWSTWYQSNSE